MQVQINDFEKLVVNIGDYDKCQKCANKKRCPLIQAISQEVVILHYSEIQIEECGLFKKG